MPELERLNPHNFEALDDWSFVPLIHSGNMTLAREIAADRLSARFPQTNLLPYRYRPGNRPFVNTIEENVGFLGRIDPGIHPSRELEFALRRMTI